jgi:hypothetical protein
LLPDYARRLLHLSVVARKHGRTPVIALAAGRRSASVPTLLQKLLADVEAAAQLGR